MVLPPAASRVRRFTVTPETARTWWCVARKHGGAASGTADEVLTAGRAAGTAFQERPIRTRAVRESAREGVWPTAPASLAPEHFVRNVMGCAQLKSGRSGAHNGSETESHSFSRRARYSSEFLARSPQSPADLPSFQELPGLQAGPRVRSKGCLYSGDGRDLGLDRSSGPYAA